MANKNKPFTHKIFVFSEYNKINAGEKKLKTKLPKSQNWLCKYVLINKFKNKIQNILQKLY
jgi:hypothetical protein